MHALFVCAPAPGGGSPPPLPTLCYSSFADVCSRWTWTRFIVLSFPRQTCPLPLVGGVCLVGGHCLLEEQPLQYCFGWSRSYFL